jgi:hypothetical protein
VNPSDLRVYRELARNKNRRFTAVFAKFHTFAPTDHKLNLRFFLHILLLLLLSLLCGKCPTRRRLVSTVCLRLPFQLRPCLLFLYLLEEMSHKEAAGVQRVSSAALPAETLPAISIPAGENVPQGGGWCPACAFSCPSSSGLACYFYTCCDDLLVQGRCCGWIPPSGPTALSDPDGLKTVSYSKETATSNCFC